jgi:pyruvate dehydrogenase E2 component (dihydrolipoamide acetyltransferase)
MAISIVMPALEMAQETGKLISWLKKEGDTVAKGEMLLEIETDKAVMEIESPGDGILAAVSAQPGAEVPVGQTIAWIVSPGEVPPLESAPAQSGRRSDSAKEASAVAETSSSAANEGVREARISPKARRLAKEKGIDLATVRGSGPEGEILADDILAAGSSASAKTPAAVVGAVARLALGPVGKLMASRTAESWMTVPHFFVTREVDATNLKAERENKLGPVEREYDVKLTITDLLVWHVARALRQHPRVNASWAGETLQMNAGIHIALAMAVEEGVVAAVIHDADKLEPGAIAVQRRDLAQRARAGKLRPNDIAGGTFTISNLGMLNVDSFTAIITPPQAAILAVGRIADRVVALNGEPAVRPMMSVTLSSDHRVIDGAGAARFLNDLVVALEVSAE